MPGSQFSIENQTFLEVRLRRFPLLPAQSQMAQPPEAIGDHARILKLTLKVQDLLEETNSGLTPSLSRRHAAHHGEGQGDAERQFQLPEPCQALVDEPAGGYPITALDGPVAQMDQY